MIKLSANETKWSSLLARTRALILIFRFEYLISGPKSYRDFRERGPRSENRCENDIFWSETGPGFRELDGAPPPSKGAVIIFHYIT